jgi:lipoprotein-anchoring transpeptidase ErfK/SrfK
MNCMYLLSLLTVAVLAHPPGPPAAAAQKPAPPSPAAAQKPAARTPPKNAKPAVPSKTAAQKKAETEQRNAEALQQQVMLDRAGVSPGIIDGRPGANTTKALAVFQAQHPDGAVPSGEPLTRYRITAEDAAGPFVEIPTDMMEKSKLPALGYSSLLEALSERFHSTPALLGELNPGVALGADVEIQVPNVDPMLLPLTPLPKDPAARGASAPAKAAPAPATPPSTSAPGATTPAQVPAAPPPAPPKPVVVVTVAKAQKSLTVTDVDGKVVFYAPVTTGSEHDPLPIGEWKVNGVQMHPTFRYNPALFWDADPAHTKAAIPAGPNNPVGVVWIDISKDHYGLHGTPEPATIGRTESHGCVRLTNWDALKLAAMVKPGTRVVFTP